MAIYILWAAFIAMIGVYVWMKKSKKTASDAAPASQQTTSSSL